MLATQVVMFPGLGASYAQMVEKFVAGHPDAAAAVDDWSARVGMDLRTPAPATPWAAERARQFEIHALNLLWWRRCRAEARAADAAVCGHSLGYYAALVAAGVVSEADSFALIDAAFDAGWREFGDTDDAVFVVTTKEPVDFDTLLAGVAVDPLAENSALQRVLYGARACVDQVAERLGDRLLGINVMPSRVPFHAPAMRRARPAFEAAVARLGIVAAPLRAQLWSHLDARPVRDGAAALALVADQLHAPVRWQRLIEALVQAGRFEFLEVGPNRVLSQSVRWICPHLEVRFVDPFRRPRVAA